MKPPASARQNPRNLAPAGMQPARPPLPPAFPFRLAETCQNPADSSYPARADDPNVYWFRFLRSEYTETAGDQTVTDTPVTTDGVQLVCNAYDGANRYLPEGTRIVVFRIGLQWWCNEPGRMALRCNATMAAAMAEVDATGTVNNVVPCDGGQSPVSGSSDTLTVANGMDRAADSGGLAKIEWNPALSQWEFYDLECPAA